MYRTQITQVQILNHLTLSPNQTRKKKHSQQLSSVSPDKSKKVNNLYALYKNGVWFDKNGRVGSNPDISWSVNTNNHSHRHWSTRISQIQTTVPRLSKTEQSQKSVGNKPKNQKMITTAKQDTRCSTPATEAVPRSGRFKSPAYRWSNRGSNSWLTSSSSVLEDEEEDTEGRRGGGAESISGNLERGRGIRRWVKERMMKLTKLF